MPVVTVIGGNGTDHVYVQYDTMAYATLATALLGGETDAFLISAAGTDSIPAGTEFVGIGSMANGQGIGSVTVTDTSVLTDQLILVGNGTNLTLDATVGGGTVIAGDGADLFTLSNTWTVDAGAATTVASASGSFITIDGTATVVGATSGTDTVFGGAGALTYYGGTSDSTVVAGTGSTLAFGGGPGTSTDVFLNGAATSDTTVIAGPSAVTNVIGSTTPGGTPATVFGGGDGAVINFYGATSGVLIAGSGNETLNAASSTGDNALYAGTGDDSVAAGSGSDTLFGGSGDATLTGGSGSDLFDFVTDGGGNTVDINDFTSTDAVQLLDGMTYTETVGSDSTTLLLSDNTTVVFQGVTDLNTGDIFTIS